MLQHVTLEVCPGEVRACVAFWALVGFDEIPAPPALRDEFTWVQREGTQIHLVAVELDRCWDLLRQRRALRSAGADPDAAAARDAGTVEQYLQ